MDPESDSPTKTASRRSGRQRTVSKRLQDMEVDFGGKKSPKRPREGIPTTPEKGGTPKKQKLTNQTESPKQDRNVVLQVSKPQTEQVVPPVVEDSDPQKEESSITVVPKINIGPSGKEAAESNTSDPEPALENSSKEGIPEKYISVTASLEEEVTENKTSESTTVAKPSIPELTFSVIKKKTTEGDEAGDIRELQAGESDINQNPNQSPNKGTVTEPKSASSVEPSPPVPVQMHPNMCKVVMNPGLSEETVTWIQLDDYNDQADTEADHREDASDHKDPDNNDGEISTVDESKGEVIQEASIDLNGSQQILVLQDGQQVVLSIGDDSPEADTANGTGKMAIITNTDNTTDSVQVEVPNKNQAQQEKPTYKIKFVDAKSNLKLEKDQGKTELNLRLPTVLRPDGYYMCTLCAYKTDKKGNWYKHRYTHLDERRYKCDTCNHKTTSSSNLKRHMQIHTNTRTFICHYCKTQFRQKIHLDRHIKYKHEVKSIRCKHCDFVCTKVVPDLKAHMKRKHVFECGEGIGQLQYRCGTCGLIASSNRDLKQHQKFHQPGPELKLYCEVCSFVTDCPSRLRRHSLVHSKERPFQCEICLYKASQKEHILRHMRKKHKNATSDGAEGTIEDAEVLREDNKTEDEGGQTEEEIPGLGQTEKDGTGEETAQDTSNVIKVIATSEPTGETESDSAVTEENQAVEGGVEGKDNPQSVDPDFPPDSVVMNLLQQKKKYKPADFSTREKVFTCIHCTMKFAKLINLYKHLSVQHKDMESEKSDGLHSCVWCEYQTNKWKNLLVHMRKHNYKECVPKRSKQQQIFSCVLCDYTSARRKSVYMHMMKRHKIKLHFKSDGTTHCVLDGSVPVTNVDQVIVQEATAAASSNTETGEVVVAGVEEAGKEERTQMVMIELEPGMPATAIEISAPTRPEGVDHEAADAIEGLQALSQQVITVDQGQGQGQGQGQEVRQGQEQVTEIIESHVVEEEKEKEAVQIEGSKIELSAEQIMELSSGDYIEINGELYKVEVAEESPTVIT